MIKLNLTSYIRGCQLQRDIKNEIKALLGNLEIFKNNMSSNLTSSFARE